MSTIRAWQYTAANGALEKSVSLEEHAAALPRLAKTEVLIDVVSMSLNPADYKVPELGLVSKAVFATPATPGADFSGRVAAIGDLVDWFTVGEPVFGRLEPTQHGTLGQRIVIRTGRDVCADLPAGLGFDEAAALGTAGLTAWQSVAGSGIGPGDKVFINGGAGGTGTFGIQIAKALGCHVTVSCSADKSALCRSLGADETIDYTVEDVSQVLSHGGQTYHLVVDNIGSPSDLYKMSDNFLLPDGKFVQVGSEVSWENAKSVTSRLLLPAFLGGGRRKYEVFMLKNRLEDLQQLGKWAADGKIKVVIDETYEFEDAKKAIEKLKTGRVAGKVIVHVGRHEYRRELNVL